MMLQPYNMLYEICTLCTCGYIIYTCTIQVIVDQMITA